MKGRRIGGAEGRWSVIFFGLALVLAGGLLARRVACDHNVHVTGSAVAACDGRTLQGQ